MPRFVVLFHQLPNDPVRSDHWDFMLEDAGILLTWELPLRPNELLQATKCRRLPDHRLAYLEYEGPVSKDRGTVARWDHGSFEFLTQTSYLLEGRLAGHQLLGAFRIEFSGEIYLFSFHPSPA